MKILQINNFTSIQEKCVATIGMFDGVHIGHRKILTELTNIAKEQQCKSIVITFNNHPRSVLEKDSLSQVKLIQTTSERFQTIASYNIDYLIAVTFTKEFASLTPKQFLDEITEQVNIKYLLLGYDNRFGNPSNGEYDELLKTGFYKNIEIRKDEKGIDYKGIEVSSTQIRKAISLGEIDKANNMLTRPYNITANVIKGFQNGTKIGFPTANILPPKEKIIPKSGVYLTKVIYNNNVYNSITNIGNNPTFEGKETTIESYIMDFSKNLYGEEISIEFLHFVRDEIKFENKEQLRKQMQEDIEYAKKYFA